MGNMAFRKLLLCGCMTLTFTGVSAQTDRLEHCVDTCSVRSREHCLKAKQLIAPATLIAVGAFGVSNGAMHELNDEVRKAIGGGKHKSIRIDEVMPFLPAAAAYGLDLCGVKAKHGVKDRTVLLVMSMALTQGMSKGTKAVVKEWRPDGSDHHSFPSGHTVMAFMSAEYLRREYRDVSPWIGVAGYAVAVGTGVMRMYNDKHWLNDVIAGAGVGILGTQMAYWLYPWVQKHLVFGKKGSKNSSAMLLPYYENRTMLGGSCGILVALNF